MIILKRNFKQFVFSPIYLRRLLNLASQKLAMLQGMKVGEKTKFVGRHSFGTEPYLISIGKSCLITNNVCFVCHDGAIQVPFIADGLSIDEVYSNMSSFGRIQIGDNVFIGMGSIILPNTQIGNNSIIGAGAVVKGIFPNNVVIAGNPAKVIQDLSKYQNKNKSNVLKFAKDVKFADRKNLILLENPPL